MNKFRSILTAVLITVVLISGCNSSGTPSQPEMSTSYYPLNLGNVWEYERTDSASGYYRRSVHGVGVKYVGNVGTFEVVDSVFYNDVDPSVSRYSLVHDGINIRESTGAWSVTFDSSWTDSNPNHGYVSRHLDSLTVPAGVFHNVVRVNYAAQQVDGMATEYYSRGVGLLRIEPFGPTSSLVRAFVNGKKYGN